MTVNPMQRRTRSSFILGFGVAVLVALVIIAALVVTMRNINAKLKEEQAKQRMLLVSSADIPEYSEVNSMNTIMENTIVSLNLAEVATIEDLTPEGKKILSKTRIPKGTVITKAMLISEEEKDVNDLRLYELNMLMIPSKMMKDEVVDIRLTLPNGQDFIVVPKKVVQEADADSIWIKMTEAELLTFNNAMVESYLIEGSKLYAAPYVHPGIQREAAQTYPLSQEALALIKDNANIVDQARRVVIDRHNRTVSIRTDSINRLKQQALQNNGIERVYQGVQDEITNMQRKREQYIEELIAPTI